MTRPAKTGRRRLQLWGQAKQRADRPAIPDHVSVIPHGPDVVEFRSGSWHASSTFLTDETGSGQLFKLCAAMDGSRDVAQIAALAGVPAGAVSDVLDALIGLNLAATGGQGLLRLGSAALLGADISGLITPQREICVIGDGELAEAMAAALASSLGQIGVVPSCAGADLMETCRKAGATYDALEREQAIDDCAWLKDKFLIYAGAYPDPLACKGINLCSLAHRAPWLFSAVDGPFVLVGPLFVPPETACFECFETRIAMNLRDHKSYVEYKQALATAPPAGARRFGASELLQRLLVSHVAIEAANFILSGRSGITDRMLAIHVPSMEFSYHELLRMPYCSACGSAPDRDGSELYFSLSDLFGPRPS